MFSSPGNQQQLQPEDNTAMQVNMDESADHQSLYPSTPTRHRHTLTSSESKVFISDDAFEDACFTLARSIHASDTDKDIRRSMTTVWNTVHHALREDPHMKPRCATEEEFMQNVARKGEAQVINSFRDAAEKQSWRDLIEDGTSSFLLTFVVIMFCCQMYF